MAYLGSCAQPKVIWQLHFNVTEAHAWLRCMRVPTRHRSLHRNSTLWVSIVCALRVLHLEASRILRLLHGTRCTQYRHRSGLGHPMSMHGVPSEGGWAVVGPVRGLAGWHQGHVHLCIGSKTRHAKNSARRVPETVVEYWLGGADTWGCSRDGAMLGAFRRATVGARGRDGHAPKATGMEVQVAGGGVQRGLLLLTMCVPLMARHAPKLWVVRQSITHIMSWWWRLRVAREAPSCTEGCAQVGGCTVV